MMTILIDDSLEQGLKEMITLFIEIANVQHSKSEARYRVSPMTVMSL